MTSHSRRTILASLPALGTCWWQTRRALAAKQEPRLIVNVRIFDGRTPQLSDVQHVLIEGNIIARILGSIPPNSGMPFIDGGGRTLMPGLIDAQARLFPGHAEIGEPDPSDADLRHQRAGLVASELLMRGVTAIRDAGGGGLLGLKRAIDEGSILGPRIWPTGAVFAKTAGLGETDVVDLVREQLSLGASQIRFFADTAALERVAGNATENPSKQLEAAVAAASQAGTYVTVEAAQPHQMRQAITAGVKCIEHGHLVDEVSAAMLAQSGVWWCPPPATDEEAASELPARSISREPQAQGPASAQDAYTLAKRFNIKTAFGTDTPFGDKHASQQGVQLASLSRWYSSAEALCMATGANGELLALSGARSPYRGKLGVIEEGALADLLLVDGDPLTNIRLIEDPAKNFLVIIKDGVVVKRNF